MKNGNTNANSFAGKKPWILLSAAPMDPGSDVVAVGFVVMRLVGDVEECETDGGE
jgi:hypothetical protein